MDTMLSINRCTSIGRVATRGAHSSDVKDTPVGKKIVLTCIEGKKKQISSVSKI